MIMNGNGYVLEGNNYELKDVESFFKDIENIPTIIGKHCVYYNVPCSFDIETSSFYREGEKESIKSATMYIWQFGINGHTIRGRQWSDFFNFLTDLSSRLLLSPKKRLIIYVHNLSFEFQFMRKWVKWDDVFSIKTRTPIYAIAGGFEFRCSYYLSNYNLAYLGDNLLRKYKVQKMVGDLDYDKIRNSETPLTTDELTYCLNDIRVVMAYIQEKIENEGGIQNIPLTNTGYVRNYCRAYCFGELYDKETTTAEDAYRDGMNYRAIIRSLKVGPVEYTKLKDAFMGGFTHASAFYANQTLENVEVNADLTSAYPANMVYRYFPMSSSTYIGQINNHLELEFYLKKFCCLFDCYYVNLQPKVLYENIISISRCTFIDSAPYVANNGRLVSCYSDDPEKPAIFRTTLTELDFNMIDKFYTYEGVYIENMFIYERGYLPSQLVKATLDFYNKKTSLKNVEGKESEYMVSKNMLNSEFGMMVTDIVRDLFDYDSKNENWYQQTTDVEGSIEGYNRGYKRFLFYPWGVWVTAHARYNLFSAILEMGEDYVYSDTDSVKGFNLTTHRKFFENYNEEIKGLAIQAAARHGIPIEDFSPKDPKGIPHLLGVWDLEQGYEKFKTCGAKRYIYVQNNKLNLVVAGLGKKAALEYFKSLFDDKYDEAFKFFQDGMYIPMGSTGKLTHTYIDDEHTGILYDYLGNPAPYKELSAVHLEPASFEMNLLVQYLDYLSGLQIEVGTFYK